jgi:hypothetical protein
MEKVSKGYEKFMEGKEEKENAWDVFHQNLEKATKTKKQRGSK